MLPQHKVELIAWEKQEDPKIGLPHVPFVVSGSFGSSVEITIGGKTYLVDTKAFYHTAATFYNPRNDSKI